MDAFELLKADHKKVAQLFDQLESARGKTKVEVFKQIKSELELHAHVEETIFYPAVEKPEETHDLTLEAYQEHKILKTLLAELAATNSAADEWQAKAKVLRENVEHHVKEEENELFKKADDVLSDEQIETIGAQMETEKARKQGRPALKHPVSRSSNTSKDTNKPGLLSKIASIVGLGAKPKKKTAKKTAANKKAGAGKREEVESKKNTKITARAVSKKGGKTSTASAGKRSAPAKGSKKASTSQLSRAKKGSSSKKGAAKKRANKK